jgi:hypothetical protein
MSTSPLHVVPAEPPFVSPQTDAQAQAGRFATNQDDYARMERNGSIRGRVVPLLGTGQPGRVHYELERTFWRQVRILGLAYAAIPGKPYEQGGDLP